MATTIPALLHVLHRAWTAPFTTRSNDARQHAETIAQAAGLGLITTRQQGTWGSVWRITSRGLRFLEDQS